MATPQYIDILDFSPGQNNAFDPRAILPYGDSTSAEAVLVENYDLVERGALVTAPGYELIATLGTGEPTRHVCQYTYDSTYRYLLAATKNKAYQLRKATMLTVHDCDTYNSGTYGTFVGTNGMGSVSTNNSSYLRGAGCVSGTIAATSTNATLTVDPLTSVDLTTYTYLELFIYLNTIRNALNTADVFTSVEVRIGSSPTDYYTRTFTSPTVGSWASARWHGIQFTLSGASSVGTPNIAALDYFQLIFNAGATYAGGEVRVDHIVASKNASTYSVIDITGPNWAVTPSTDTYLSSVDFKGLNSLQYRVIANSDQTAIKVRHVGPGMLITEQVSSIVRTHILAEMNNFLFWANDRTVSYSGAEDETTTSGTIGFPAKVMGLAPTTNDIMLVGTQDRMTYSVGFSFDSSTLIYTPIRKPYRAGVGAMSHNSIRPVYNDSMVWGTDGVIYYGQYENEGNSNYKTDSLSWKIDPKIQNTNLAASENATGYFFSNRKEYGLAAPIGTDQTFNNRLFVYKKQYDSWAERSGISMGSACEYRETNQFDLVFGSATNDKIYRFYDYYDYAGSNYTRRWVSKIFHFGYPTLFKTVHWIEIAGSMPRGCEFYLIVHIDGETRTFKISDSSLLLNYIDTSGFYGDDNYGSMYYGGDEAGSLSFTPYRFVSRVEQPRSTWEGREFQFEFYNNTTGMPHKIDFVRIKYSIGPEDKLAQAHHQSEIVANFEL